MRGAVLVRPRWNQERLRRRARRFCAGSRFLYGLLLAALTSARFALALVQAAWTTVLRLLTRITARAFWRGEGNLVDSAHGGLLTHYWTPGRAIAELETLHFQPERIRGDDDPPSTSRYSTDWFYYVFVKRLRR